MSKDQINVTFGMKMFICYLLAYKFTLNVKIYLKQQLVVHQIEKRPGNFEKWKKNRWVDKSIVLFPSLIRLSCLTRARRRRRRRRQTCISRPTRQFVCVALANMTKHNRCEAFFCCMCVSLAKTQPKKPHIELIDLCVCVLVLLCWRNR